MSEWTPLNEYFEPRVRTHSSMFSHALLQYSTTSTRWLGDLWQYVTSRTMETLPTGWSTNVYSVRSSKLSVDGIFALIKRVTANGFRCSHCKRDFGPDTPHEHVLFAGIRCPACYAEHLEEVEREHDEIESI